MSGHRSMIAVLFRTELKMVLRDRRILFSSIVLPLLITPLMFLGSHWSLQRRERTLREMVYHYSVVGANTELVRTLIATARDVENRGRTESGAPTSMRGRRHRNMGTAEGPSFRFQEVATGEPLVALNRGEVHLVLELLDGDAGGTNTLAAPGKDEPETEPPVPGAATVRLLYRADRDDSSAAMAEMQAALDRVRQEHRVAMLAAHGFPYRTTQVAAVQSHDLATQTQVAGLFLGKSLTLILLILVLTSGAVVATDSIAGEKERGTWETILSSSVDRVQILAAKTLVILAIALLITVIQAGNLLVYVGLKLLPVPAGLSAALTPWSGLMLILLFLPVLVLAAGCLLLVSGYARSYREAQMYFLPVLLIGLLPALAPFLPGVPLRSAIVMVPIANIALAAKEILVGTYDWPMIAVSWVVTAAAALWSLRFGVRFLSVERLVTAETGAAEFEGGPALFERQVLRWYAVAWAALIVVGNYFEKSDLRVQIAVNLVGLLFGSCCLMVWRYRLNPRLAAALRAPRPWVWLGVLLAVPGGLLTSLGLFKLAELVLPVSSKMAEAFDQSVIPRGLSLGQLILFLAVMPGIFEELAFRGLLLHGLRRRLHPAALAVVVGLAFGFFHVALFRFVPTACLGMMLAGVTLLTGSIFPAMVWHGLNNATGILMYKQHIPETDLPVGCYFAGVGILAAAFWIFWRNRTPYPDLRR